jgi:hypothetical protein
MSDPVIILAPPRSFTSVICNMLGQHPQMYGLPEVNLFVAETMREREGILAQYRFAKHGLLRAIAQLFAENQTVQTIALAQRWLEVRANATYEAVFRELTEKIGPQVPVDKSILTAWQPEHMARVQRAFPKARFIHLVRHPRTQGESLWRQGGIGTGIRPGAVDYHTTVPIVDFQIAWYTIHMNILTFLKGVPGQYKLLLRGEDLLAKPALHLRQIAAWLCLRDDTAAIEAMQHPERSPYASLGPSNAPFGNDPGFLRQPKLSHNRRMNAQTLDGPLIWRLDGSGFRPEVRELALQFGYH